VQCVADCIVDCVWLAVPQPTEWQRIGDQIDAVMIFAGPQFVKVLRAGHPVNVVGWMILVRPASVALG